MLDTNNHLYQWLKSPTCTILGTKNDRCLQDKIILDSIILSRNSLGWYNINQYIKYPDNSMNTIFLTNYDGSFCLVFYLSWLIRVRNIVLILRLDLS